MPTDLNPNPPPDVIPRQPESWDETSTGVSVLDLLLTLAERKWFILAMTAGGGIVMCIIAFLLPPRYTATASIMAPQQQQSTASMLLGQLGPIAAAAGGNLGIKTPGDLYLGILASRTIADNLIQTFDLRRVYDEPTVFDARKVLTKRSSFATGKDSLIKISVDDHDPKRAAALANAYVDQLYKQNGRLALTESAQRRLFFERELESEKKSLANAEVALRATQERTGVLQVTSQVESVIMSLARLRAEITTREVALSSLKSAATAQNPAVVREEAELSVMREKLQTLETSADPIRPGDPMIPTSRMPKAGLEYVRALRDLKYSETLFEMLSRQYEAARIDEAKEAPVIQVVDSAIPPERKSWPPRAVFTVAGALCCGALAGLIAVMGSHLQNNQDSEKLRLLKSRVFG